MAEHTNLPTPPERLGDVEAHLAYLKLPFSAAQYATLAKDAAHKAWSHVDYLARLLEGEAAMRRDRATKSRIRLARFPVIKTVEQFRWDWPTRINRLQVQNHFRLAFLQDKANLIFLGGVGLGKTHLATALGYAACLQGHSVLFASAIDVINTLAAAKSAGRLKPWSGWHARRRAVAALTRPTAVSSFRGDPLWIESGGAKRAARPAPSK